MEYSLAVMSVWHTHTLVYARSLYQDPGGIDSIKSASRSPSNSGFASVQPKNPILPSLILTHAHSMTDGYLWWCRHKEDNSSTRVRIDKCWRQKQKHEGWQEKKVEMRGMSWLGMRMWHKFILWQNKQEHVYRDENMLLYKPCTVYRLNICLMSAKVAPWDLIAASLLFFPPFFYTDWFFLPGGQTLEPFQMQYIHTLTHLPICLYQGYR